MRSVNAPYPRPWTTNLTDGTQGANRLSVPGHTENYNAGIQYSRLLHRRCTSLDLEAAFKEIKISQNIEKEVCAQCRTETCRCPAFTPGMPCSSASSTPTNISDKQIPDLVENKTLENKPLLYCILQCNHLLTKKPIKKLQRFVEHLNITR